jgi:hypothetical protein
MPHGFRYCSNHERTEFKQEANGNPKNFTQGLGKKELHTGQVRTPT